MSVPGPWLRTARAAGLVDADGIVQATVFARMSAIAASRGAINLGQGFPDYDGPAEVLAAAARAIADGANQYPPGRGIPALRRAIAAHQRRFHGLEWDADTEVLVTAGATEAIAASVLALVEPGDEVVVVEPFYDSYAALVGLAGGQLVAVPASAPDFLPEAGRLVDAIRDRTRVVLLNSPHNPTGAMLPAETLRAVVDAAARHDAVIVSDEVYEHLGFRAEHVSIAAVPGARERSITISSAAKTFSVTGWKVGWITAPAPLLDAVLAVKQFLTYVNGAPFQPAVALGLGLPDAVFDAAASALDARRARLTTALESAGFTVNRPHGGYFLIADGTPLELTDAVTAAELLVDRAGVVAIPVTAFVTPGSRAAYAPYLRFAFCKRDEVIDEAAARLAAFRP
ncbi:MAG: aminotransferase class I/II-fold pyridoxal phosphate-dependent enzyme [Micrococcales bacterium]|nr:aminotransferase class I/II-fold pyridoxal phosphate-dependent enzyme [Micrococcales bacterium]